MCVRTIIDANAFRHFCEETPQSAGDQLRRWIGQGNGVVVYSPKDTDYAAELNRYIAVRDLLKNYYQSGRAFHIGTACIKDELGPIQDCPYRRSDDPHILALAAAGNATVLFSCDKKLRKDFANNKVLPKVDRKHRRSIPGLVDEKPADTENRRERQDFLSRRKCSSPR